MDIASRSAETNLSGRKEMAWGRRLRRLLHPATPTTKVLLPQSPSEQSISE